MFNKAYTGYNPCGCGPNSYYNQPIVSENCGTCQEDVGCIFSDAKCIIYNGNAYPCGNIDKGNTVEDVIQKFAAILCETGIDPDYSSYNTYCLTDSGSTSTQSEFVETISNFVCQTNTTLQNFITTTYPTFVTSITNTVNGIRIPGTTGCVSMPIPNGSTINQVLQIFSNTLCGIATAINVSSLDWDGCFTVISQPTNVYEGFAEVLRQICILQSNPGSGGDTYKVKTDATDTTEDFLFSKIKGTPCITTSIITDIDAKKKVQISLGFTPSRYTFNPSQFDTTTGTSDGCVQTYNVSIKPGLIGGADCDIISNIFDSGSTALMYSFLGKDSTDNCIALDDCYTRYSLFKSFGDGTYNIKIDNTATDFCDKFVLVPTSSSYILPIASPTILGGIKVGSGLSIALDGTLSTISGSGTVTSVGVTGNSIFDITNSPITSSGNINVELSNQSANTGLYGPTTGIPAIPTFRTMITADIPNQTVTYPKIQNVIAKRLLGRSTPSTGTVQEISIDSTLNLSDGGVLSVSPITGLNPCATTPYSSLPMLIPGSGSNGSGLSYDFVDYTQQVSTLLNTRQSEPTIQGKFDIAGNLALLGNATFRLTTALGNVNTDILIPFANVSSYYAGSNPCTDFNQFMNKLIGTYIIQDSATGFGFVEAYLCLNPGGTQQLDLLLKVKSVVKLLDSVLTIAFDGLILPLHDIN